MLRVGNRIKDLREQAGISQEKLAKLLGVARPTVTGIERGQRRLTVDELVKLSEIFGVTADAILDKDKAPEVTIREDGAVKPTEPMRISVPQKNLKKFQEVLLYILNKVGGKPNIGQTVIYKLLYFMDFNCYEKFEEQLIGATYIKNNYGPTPVEFKKVVDGMIKNREITEVKDKFFEYPRTKYLPLRPPDLSVLNANEKDMIDDVLCRLSDMNAKEISEYSHKDVPWITAKNSQKIEYEAVFYRTPPYSVRKADVSV